MIGNGFNHGHRSESQGDTVFWAVALEEGPPSATISGNGFLFRRLRDGQTCARAEVIDPNEVTIVHAFNRTVRRCFLIGDDPLTGKNFDHRKVWIEELLEQFAASFAIDLLCFSILSNHYQLILRSRPDVVVTWDDREVARRWLRRSVRSVLVSAH